MPDAAWAAVHVAVSCARVGGGTQFGLELTSGGECQLSIGAVGGRQLPVFGLSCQNARGMTSHSAARGWSHPVIPRSVATGNTYPAGAVEVIGIPRFARNDVAATLL